MESSAAAMVRAYDLMGHFTIIRLMLLGAIAWINMIPLGSAEMGIEMRVVNDVFHDYDPGVRPIKDIQQPINVTIMFKLYQIVELDDTSETVTTINWISMYWVDPLLTWNSSDYSGIDMIYVPCTRVWRPDITIYNGLHEGEQDLRLYDSFNAKVASNGKVLWSFRAVFKTSCSLRLTEFPWDTQVCNLTMGSWLYDTSYVTVKPTTDFVDLRQFRRNALWDVIRAPIVATTLMYPCCNDPFDEITLYYILRRNGLYYCFNILFPSALLLGTTLLSFLIPIESGEKISIPVTMFLSQSFLLFAITQFMPVQSDVIPAIGYILLGVMMLIGLCIVCNIAVCYVYYKCNGPPPTARFLKLLCLWNDKDFKNKNEHTAQDQLLDTQEEINLNANFRKQSDGNQAFSQQNQSNSPMGNLRLRGKSLSACSGCSRHCNSDTDQLDTSQTPGSEKWKEVAQRLNQILCIGTLFATFGFAMAVMVIYMENRKHTEKQFYP